MMNNTNVCCCYLEPTLELEEDNELRGYLSSFF